MVGMNSTLFLLAVASIISISCLVTGGNSISNAYAVSEFTTFQNISSSPYESMGPSVAVDDKDVFVAWTEFAPDNKSSEIFFAKSADGGETFTDPQNISGKKWGSINPFFVVNGDEILITWTYRYPDIGGSEIFFAKSADGGETFSTPQKISKDDSFSVGSKIAVLNDEILITWFDTTFSDNTPTNLEVFFVKSTDDGATFSSPLNLSNNPGYSSHPSVVAVNDTIVVVWQDENPDLTDIFVSRSTDGGTTFSSPYNISNSEVNSVGSEIITDGTDIFVTWWDTQSSSGDIFFSKSTDNGISFSAPQNISNDKINSISPFVATDGTNIFVTWTDATIKDSRINFSKSADGGSTFAPPQKISNTEGFSSAPSIAVADETVFAAWNYGESIESKRDIIFTTSQINHTSTQEPSEQVPSSEKPEKQSETNPPTGTESADQNHVLGAIEWVDSIPYIDGYGLLKITDPDMNTDPDRVDIFTAKAWSETDPDGISLDMIESETNTGVFYIDIMFTLKDSAIQKIETIPGDTVTASYLDLTTPDGREMKITDTITVISDHMPTRKQLEFGILPEDVKCKDGMELIFKNSDGSPACVTSETKKKLIERGWMKDKMQHLCEKFSGNWNKDYATCFDFSDDYDCENMGGKLVGRAYTGELPDYSKQSDSFACEFRK